MITGPLRGCAGWRRIRRPWPLARSALVIAWSGSALGSPPSTAVAQEVTGPSQRGETLTLEGAIRTALSRNPSIESADASASAAAAARWADWGAFIPTADLSLNLSQTDFKTITFLSPEGVPQTADPAIEGERKNSFLGLSFSWDVFRGGQNIAGVKSGAARSRAAEFRLNDAERVVVRDVKVSYLEALKAQRLVEVAESQLTARREDLAVSEERYRIAGVTRSDLLGAQGEVAQAELTLLDRVDAKRAAVRDLQVNMGFGPGELDPDMRIEDIEALPDASGLNADSLVARAAATDPQLLALVEDQKAAKADVWASRATYVPTISLGYNLNRGQDLGPNESLFNIFPDNTTNSFSIRASWPLFTGFSRKQQNAQASSDLRRARADHAQRTHDTDRTIRDLVDQIQRRRRRIDLLETLFRLDTERVELARQQYRLGTLPYDNLLIAITQQTNSQQTLLQERYDYLRAWAELERLVGGGPR
jgi:outer membrane protein